MEQNKLPLLKKLKSLNITLSNVIHSFSHISKSVEMGEGNYIGPGVVIAPQVKMGNYNIINRSASIGHNVHIGNLNLIGPGAVLTGFDKIGDNNSLGANCTVLPRKIIKNNIILGAGAALTKDATIPGIYTGIPAIRRLK
jgi:UDP-3-O-[3-hydroxymyristoyl] glucosamine N-acyltransferase